MPTWFFLCPTVWWHKENSNSWWESNKGQRRKVWTYICVCPCSRRTTLRHFRDGAYLFKNQRMSESAEDSLDLQNATSVCLKHVWTEWHRGQPQSWSPLWPPRRGCRCAHSSVLSGHLLLLGLACGCTGAQTPRKQVLKVSSQRQLTAEQFAGLSYKVCFLGGYSEFSLSPLRQNWVFAEHRGYDRALPTGFVGTLLLWNR